MTQLVTTDQRVSMVRDAITKSENELARVLTGFMTGQKERFLQLAITAATKPDMVQAEPISIVAAVMKAAQCGLPIDGTHAALVAYREHGVPKAQFIPMFQGLIVAAMRNGEVKSIWSRVVYQGDEFRETGGTSPGLIHTPSTDYNRTIDKAVCVYACAKLSSGEVIFEVMDRKQVEWIKNSSKAKSGPWSNPQNEAEMWRKTAVRRLAKYMPKSPDLQRVLDADEEFEPLEPREPEYEPVTPPDAGGPKRNLSDMTPKNGAAEKSPEKEKPRTVDASPVPPVRWVHDIEINLAEPADKWVKTKIGGKSLLADMTFEDAVTSTDEKVRAEVERILAEGAALQDKDGRTAPAYQKLAEASRLYRTAGPVDDPFAQ